MNQRLELVEEQVAAGSTSQGSSKKDYQKLSKESKVLSRNFSKIVDSTSDSSDEEVGIPTLAEMRASAALQKKIDSKISSLVTNKSDKGNDHNPKLKSKRGGGQLMFWYLKKWRGHMSTFWGRE